MYRVIIVEDEPEIARSTKSCVEKNPEFQVKAIFSDGQEALNYIWLNPVDLIVLDLFIPHMNGKEFLYRLSKENLLADVIVVTAANDAENIREVLPYGVVDYLLKQFEGDTERIWDSNIFGRSFHELVGEDLQSKLKRMPEDARQKLRETLERIINEGSGGLICIIL